MVYNKKLERENEGYSTFHDYWYRYELRTKTDNSNRSTRLFLTLVEHEFNLNEVVPGLFMDYIRLLQPNEETLTKTEELFKIILEFIQEIKKGKEREGLFL